LQLAQDPRAPVGAPACLVRCSHQQRKAAVLTRPCRLRPLTPGVVAASRDAQRPAEQLDRIEGLLHVDEAESQWCSFAKKAAAHSAGRRNTGNSGLRCMKPKNLAWTTIQAHGDDVQLMLAEGR